MRNEVIVSNYKEIIPKQILGKITNERWMICDICREVTAENLHTVIESIQQYKKDNINERNLIHHDAIENFCTYLISRSKEEAVQILLATHIYPHLIDQENDDEYTKFIEKDWFDKLIIQSKDEVFENSKEELIAI